TGAASRSRRSRPRAPRSTTSTSTTPAATLRPRTRRADAAPAPDRVDDRAADAQPDARADLDRLDGDPAAHLALALRPALLASRRAARRRLDVHRVPDAGDRLHERV